MIARKPIPLGRRWTESLRRMVMALRDDSRRLGDHKPNTSKGRR